MNTEKKASLREMIQDLGLTVVNMTEDDVYVTTSELNRPGLQFAGYFEHFAYDRIQVVGKTEYAYFGHMKEDVREEVLDTYFSYDIPALITTRGMKINDDVIEFAKKHNRIVLSTDMNTTKFTNRLSYYLEDKLASTTTVHGVLVDVYGIGVLIRGESSIGKSETALELIQRGHRLVADDAVELKVIDDRLIVGKAPEVLKHYMEIRGIGIIDVKSLYGVGATKATKAIDIVIDLESWDSNKYYDRLGLDKEYEDILGIDIEKVTMPVKPGRNTAMIIEVVAMNFRQRAMGYDAAQEFTQKLATLIENK